ncbi:LamB/YcsF family protein [Nitrospira sp. Kam-Ns4a]
MRVDLNCDVGESDEPGRVAIEARVLESVTSVSLACGVHAGTPALMRRLIRAARARGVAVGAHPGLPDPEGLGRRELPVTPEDIEQLVAAQVRALAAVAAEEGVALAHVKPHGALYTMAARDGALAAAIVRGVAAVDVRLALFGLAGSALIDAARRQGMRAVAEAFADRAYRADGTLVPRGRDGALLHEEEAVVERVLRLVREGVLPSVDGPEVRLRAETICVHGDTPGADRLAARLREALEQAGVRLLSPGCEP